MCGIAGIMVCEGQKVAPHILDRLEKALFHRGPDHTGRYDDGRVALLNTRLAIIDLATGNQPFEAADGTVLVANCEIYNDPAIRERLPEAPYKSKSDAESALQLYRHEGPEFARDLRGMYATAIFDKSKSQLILSRDPFGIKQLYYTITPGYFAFASEAQALIAAGLAERGLNPQKRSELLQLKFTTGSETIFPGIHRLLPGETLLVQNAQIVKRTRQVLPSASEAGKAKPQSNHLQALNDVLTDSVHAHIRSDVPYGLFLSGGIDSSVLLTLMTRLTANPITALTAVFPDTQATDEGAAAEKVAKAARADHHRVEVTQEDFWHLSPAVAAALDDPTTDAAALPTFKLARFARSLGLKVVLSGEGSDEVFGGYSRYRRAALLWGLFARKSRSSGVFRDAPEDTFKGWRDGLAKTETADNLAGLTATQRLQAIDCAEWLPNDLLVKLDRCLMAFGIEGRTPFLDPIVSPFAFALPDRLKVRRKFGKWLLREWLSTAMPQAEAFSRKKGFNPPVGEWIELHKAKLVELVLAQPGIAEMEIGDLVRSNLMNATRNSQAAWSLLFYALWHSHHILGVDSSGSIGDVLSAAARSG
ncbi:asparagine synthase (glutamine-hydrolyzing) [Methylovirgula sp. 4M-Z18]|nr:asparagine synthase (glutamine-hydrolyzing) [Methylovirgula sp. 4M-Z18]